MASQKPQDQSQLADRADAQAIPQFYANAVTISVSPFDVELGSYIVAADGATRAALHLRMSPQTARTLAWGLAQKLDELEAKFGPLPLPADENS